MHICPITVTYCPLVKKIVFERESEGGRSIVVRKSVRGLVFVIVYSLSHPKVVFAREREAGSLVEQWGLAGSGWPAASSWQPLLAHQRRRIKDFYIVFCKKQKQELGKASDFWVHNGSQPVTRAEPEREHS